MSKKEDIQKWAQEELEKLKAQENPEDINRAFQDSILGLPQYWHIDEHGAKYLGTGMIPDNSCCDMRDKHPADGSPLDEE